MIGRRIWESGQSYYCVTKVRHPIFVFHSSMAILLKLGLFICLDIATLVLEFTCALTCKLCNSGYSLM